MRFSLSYVGKDVHHYRYSPLSLIWGHNPPPPIGRLFSPVIGCVTPEDSPIYRIINT